jgi:hypothetical protein
VKTLPAVAIRLVAGCRCYLFGVGIIVAVFCARTHSLQAMDGMVEGTGRNSCGTPADGLQLCIITEKNDYEVCEPIRIEMVFKNESDKPAWYVTGMTFPELMFEVRTESGERAPLTAYGRYCTDPSMAGGGSAKWHCIEPGAKFSETVLVSKAHDFTMPGMYSITARRKVYLKCFDHNSGKEITSGKLTVVVTREPLSTTDMKPEHLTYYLSKFIRDVRGEMAKPQKERDEGLLRDATAVFQKLTGWQFQLDLDAWDAFFIGKVLQFIADEDAKPRSERSAPKIEWYWQTLEETVGEKLGTNKDAWKRLAAAKAVKVLEGQLARPEKERSAATVRWCGLFLKEMTGKEHGADLEAWKETLKEMEAGKDAEFAARAE